jgi:vacuole morphology and inheritance protein 14
MLSEIIPPAITKNLGDRSYDKRKVAALELEHFIKDLNEKGDVESVRGVIRSLRVDFAESTQPNRRKGALIGLAASAIALHETSVNYLESVISPVLVMLGDEDSRVRYYACEALYNIAKVARGSILVYFNDIFQGLCNLHADQDRDVRNGAQLLDRLIKDVVTESDQFDVEHFVPLLRANIHLENPYIRQLVVGWITVLDSVPDIDMLEFLPEFLGGLFDMLADTLKDIKQQSNSALEEFLREIKEAFRNSNEGQVNAPSEVSGLGVNSPVHAISLGPMVKILVTQCESTEKAPVCRVTALNWLLEFIEIDQQYKAASMLTGGLLPHYGEMVRAVLTCISDEDQHIRMKAEQTNTSLLQVYGEFEMKADIQSEVVRSLVTNLIVHLPGPAGAPGSAQFNSPTRTRVATLKWISLLLMKSSNDVSDLLESLFPSLLNTLSEEDDSVVALDLKVLAKISSMNKNYFQLVLRKLISLFSGNQKLLETK